MQWLLFAEYSLMKQRCFFLLRHTWAWIEAVWRGSFWRIQYRKAIGRLADNFWSSNFLSRKGKKVSRWQKRLKKHQHCYLTLRWQQQGAEKVRVLLLSSARRGVGGMSWICLPTSGKTNNSHRGKVDRGREGTGNTAPLQSLARFGGWPVTINNK